MEAEENKDNKNYIVQFDKVEPSERELENKRADLFKKLSKITPDQIKEFEIDPAFKLDPFDAKSMWEKTIWAK